MEGLVKRLLWAGPFLSLWAWLVSSVVIWLFPASLTIFQFTYQPLAGYVKLLRPLLAANWHFGAFLFFVVQGLWWGMMDTGPWKSLFRPLWTTMSYLDFLHFLSSGALSLVAIFQNLISHLGIELQPVTGGSWRTWKDFFFSSFLYNRKFYTFKVPR